MRRSPNSRYPSFLKASGAFSQSGLSSNLWRQAIQLRAVEVGMSLQVFVAHTGQRLDADTNVLSSLESLRSWIAKSTAIPPQDQILLTAKGKHVKTQALLTEVWTCSARSQDVADTLSRRRYLFMIAISSPYHHNNRPLRSYDPRRSQKPICRKKLQAPFLTRQISKHGRPCSRRGKTGRTASATRIGPCFRVRKNT